MPRLFVYISELEPSPGCSFKGPLYRTTATHSYTREKVLNPETRRGFRVYVHIGTPRNLETAAAALVLLDNPPVRDFLDASDYCARQEENARRA